MIKIICVGKIKEKFYSDAILEYQKRISKYTKLEIIEVKDFNLTGNDLLKEEAEIIKNIKHKDYVILLDINGEEIDSKMLATKINKNFINYPTITFIIGGSNGVSENIKKITDERISFSKLTFPHQLFRVILLEQIYRSYKIINNEKYHK